MSAAGPSQGAHCPGARSAEGGRPLSPKGRPEGESAPKRVSAERRQVTRCFRSGVALTLCAWLALAAAPATAALDEPPVLAEAVKAGKLPPVAERLPAKPLVVPFDGPDRVPGQYGGELRMLIGRRTATSA